MDTMTSRERILTCIRGGETDRFPVWLKIGAEWAKRQDASIQAMPQPDLFRHLGCDLFLHCGLTTSTRTPHVTCDIRLEGNRRITTWETPDGPLRRIDERSEVDNTWHPTEFPGAELEGVKKLRWVFKDTVHSVDPERAEQHAARQLELEALGAATIAGVGPSPLMKLCQHLCGPDHLIYHLADAPSLVQELMAEMHEDRMRYLRALLPHLKADTFWLTENTSVTLINPAMFREHCMPYLHAYGNLVLEHGCLPVHHMCGHLKPLLEMINELPAVANEAYTTPPLGDVTLVEGRARMPSKCLIGGTNASLWLRSADEIIRAVEQDVRDCPDRRRLFLTSAGMYPPAVSLETTMRVVDAFRHL